MLYLFLRCFSIRESKSCHNVHDPETNNSDEIHVDEDEVIGANIALETGFEGRRRLDSFYSATSKKSAYYSTGSTSSYQSVEKSDSSQQSIYFFYFISPLSYHKQYLF